MDCEQARELASARIDGELDVAGQASLDRHLEGCDACRLWEAGAYALHRSAMLRPAEQPIDRTEAILARATVPDVARREWARGLVAAVGVVMLARSLPLVVLGTGAEASQHVGRHLGAFGAALAVGFLYAAWRPERAAGLLPLGAALGVTVTATGVIDLIARRSTAPIEAGHLLELVGLVALWMLAGGRRQLADQVGRRRSRPSLRAV